MLHALTGLHKEKLENCIDSLSIYRWISRHTYYTERLLQNLNDYILQFIRQEVNTLSASLPFVRRKDGLVDNAFLMRVIQIA